MTYCVPLADVNPGQCGEVGGKACSLSAVLQSGLAVPQGIVVTAGAYDTFMRLTRLREKIMMELGRKEIGSMRWEEVWDAALRIRNLFAATPISDMLRERLSEGIFPFAQGRQVVIRSSAPGEDSAELSFAGLHESFVGITGLEEILHHVKLVWASLWSDRALLYRRELKLDPFKSRMAVVIQELVEGDVSGIAFGQHPANPSSRVVEAVYGLNQALVDGSITPDRWTVDRATNRIVAHEAGDCTRMMRPGPSGPTFVAIEDERRSSPPLKESDVEAITEANGRLERLFKSPQDMEWTMAAGRLIVLQSRPITTASTGSQDRRPWYLSLTRSFENLRDLRVKIEGVLIPQMIAAAGEMADEDLTACGDEALATIVAHRARRYLEWVDVYWRDFIPYAHGIRLFGMLYNDVVQPKDPYEFMALLAETDLEAVRRNDMLQALAGVVRKDPSLRSALQAGMFLEAAFNRQLDEFIAAFGDLACGAGACLSGRNAVAAIVVQLAERPAALRPRTSYSVLRENFLSCFSEDRRAFADEVLQLGRSSYRLRDNDNIYLGRIKMQFVRALETYEKGFGSAEALKRKHSDIAAAVDMLPDDHPSRPVPAVRALETADFISKARQITGQPAGPGVARGTARVITGQGDLLSFKASEILVCDSIDPTMTFLIPLASAVVERRGGMLIHGAIIAREYGLPCVTGVENATALIRTGDVLTVDGYLGIVTIG